MEGYASVKATPVMVVALELVNVMVRFVAPFIGIVLELKLLAAMGGFITVSAADAAVMVPASVAIVPVLFV